MGLKPLIENDLMISVGFGVMHAGVWGCGNAFRSLMNRPPRAWGPGAYYVFASCTLDVGGGAFRELQAAETGLSQPSPELADFRKMVRDQPPMVSSL